MNGGGFTGDTSLDYWISAVDSVAPGAGTAAANQAATTGIDFLSSLRDVVGTVALTIQQKQILDVQMQRMRAGLAPLETSQYGLGVNVGFSPDTMRMLLIGGAGLAVLLLYLSTRRK